MHANVRSKSLTCVSLVEETECIITLVAERCSYQLATAYNDFLNTLDNDLGCHIGLFQFYS